MTSKSDTLKTNEFLRLRKLRLQQVREQSKDIAKKIRQRAKVEHLRHASNLDSNKEKVYLQRQEKLVSRLEQLYAKGLENVGASHKNASEVNKKETPEKKDLSKLRGREAVAELRKRKQQKLDEQKKLLDRKLQAREAANELSREKSVVVVNSLTKLSSSKSINGAPDKSNDNEQLTKETNVNIEEGSKDKVDSVTKNDMGTQWNFEEIPHEWEPYIPTLSIPKDDSVKNLANDNVDKSDKSKRLNLFALSDEMPSSLRGGVTSFRDDRVPLKPSLTLVSEYLQNRGLRLREPDTTSQKKNSEELQNIKQTLLKTRASRTDGSVFNNICHVLDEQVIPVPCWRAENNCGFCSQKINFAPQNYRDKLNKLTCNKSLSLNLDLQDCSLNFQNFKSCRWTHYNKCHQHRIPVSGRSNTVEQSSKLTDINSALSKKNSVTMYDHNTRDIKDMPHNVEKLVVRDTNNDEDAYSQALRESSIPEHNYTQSKLNAQEQRSRVAMAKQNVDKEYRDTLAFLNSLPKERAFKSMRTAYMDGDRQQEMKDRRQQRMQQEYKKACNKHHCKHSKCKTTPHDHNRSKSKSPLTVDIENNTISRDFQYSWLPVPESDGSLAIHTVSNNAKDKSGNTVKFNTVDTYHEYRSRHKHTPPTKDVTNEQHKRVVEAVIIQENDNDGIDSSSETDSDSVKNLQEEIDNVTIHRTDKNKHLEDAERIIIYKVIDSNKNKSNKAKKKSETIDKVNEIQTDNLNNRNTNSRDQKSQDNFDKNSTDDAIKNTVTFTQLNEGVYKSVSAHGDNMASMCLSDDQQESACNKHKPHDKGADAVNENSDKSLNRSSKSCRGCKCTNTTAHQHSDKQPSAATSTSSFKTAFNEKANHALPDNGFIKFVDEGGLDTGKFYVGASGFLKDDAYEVVIQLRKKEAEKNIHSQDNVVVQNNTLGHENIINDDLCQKPKEYISTKISTEDIKQNNPPKDNSITSLSIETDKVQQPVHDEDSKKYTQSESNDNSKQNAFTVVSPKIYDKAVCTSFRDSFAIPENAPKLDSIPRPAASTYTQTTHSSPLSRPVLMHLSSSTSTTYMSPPELVLPRYFRKGSTYDENSSNLEGQYSKQKDCKSCRCGKCKKQYKHTKNDTPPNTTRSSDKSVDNFNKQQDNKTYPESKYRHGIRKPHKCKSRSDSKTYSKQKIKRSCSDYKRTYTASNYSTLSSQKSRIVKSGSKINLNPVIENYVKKLLALNKEGLKAIEVVNQECSEVTTPGSSIIEIQTNLNKRKHDINNKISLEQIKKSLKEQILKSIDERKESLKNSLKTTSSQTEQKLKPLPKVNRRRPIHKVKSLNISKQLLKAKTNRRHPAQNNVITLPISDYARNKSSQVNSTNEVSHIGMKISTPRKIRVPQESSNNTSHSDTNNYCTKTSQLKSTGKPSGKNIKINTDTRNLQNKAGHTFPSHRATTTGHSSDSDTSNFNFNRRNVSTPPISISTQTNHVDSEVEFMKLAENKLQNMEKIADLTEKCTKRLSNLAKVLEEVRKHKSLAYSQISTSDSTSDTDQRSEKNIQGNNRVHSFNPTVEIKTLAEAFSSLPTSPKEPKKDDLQNSPPFVPVLIDIPRPDSFKTLSPISFSTESDKSGAAAIVQQPQVKNRGRPPPALTRINLKNVPADFVIPHELSTVVEVDSPMSMKFKNHTTRPDSNNDVSHTESVEDNNLFNKGEANSVFLTKNMPLDLVKKLNNSKEKNKLLSTDSSDDSKMKMMDIKQFNEIMLQPFISLQDYAKQFNVDEPDDGSIHNTISKDEHGKEDLSSLHSDASIPDVVAELLKRNLISEPFKFETTSATVSSESTLSMIALSKTRKDKKKSGILPKNKENVAESSESLSISSNPDLEHAFQRLGMGWASSTLKKTKERLALSSSSNTSSSSMSQFKIKSFNYQDVPEISKNSIMSLNISNNHLRKPQKSDTISETAKNALQQTSLTNSMTVKEFLANELAKKITFSNKSNKNTTEEEFLTLCETKMPDEMKQLSHLEGENKKSLDNIPSNSNVRARTSTPVQIFKSMTYHSTSSSNTSNGLFSNADDLSSVKVTSNSNKNHSTSDKDDLTIPNYSLKFKGFADCSKSD